MNELVIAGYGIVIGSRKGYLHLKNHKGEETLIPPSNLRGVLIAGKSIRISTNALIILSKYGVETTIIYKGKPVCKITPAIRGATLRTKQAQLEALANGKQLEIAKAIVAGKLHNQKTVIRTKAKEIKVDDIRRELETIADTIRATEEKLSKCESVDEVRAYEAYAAKLYWHGVELILPKELGFRGREVRNPVDYFNRCLNIGYGILRSRAWSALLLVGLDPYIGYLHMPRGRHLCLASDLMEEFRPAVVDRPLINQGIRNPQSLMVKNPFKTVVSIVSSSLRARENELENAILRQARRLANYIRGESEEYEPFKLRW